MPTSDRVDCSRIINVVIGVERERGRCAERVGDSRIHSFRRGKHGEKWADGGTLVKILQVAQKDLFLTPREWLFLMKGNRASTRALVVVRAPEAAGKRRLQWRVLADDVLKIVLEHAVREKLYRPEEVLYRLDVWARPPRDVQSDGAAAADAMSSFPEKADHRFCEGCGRRMVEEERSAAGLLCTICQPHGAPQGGSGPSRRSKSSLRRPVGIPNGDFAMRSARRMVSIDPVYRCLGYPLASDVMVPLHLAGLPSIALVVERAGVLARRGRGGRSKGRPRRGDYSHYDDPGT